MMNPADALYSKYISERQGLSSIWKPNAFVFFKLNHSGECYIADFFVEQSERKTGVGRELLNEVDRIAQETKCTVITANIHLKDPGCNNTLQAAMVCGFRVTAAGENVLLISKKPGEV